MRAYKVQIAKKYFSRERISDIREEHNFRVLMCFTFEGYCRATKTHNKLDKTRQYR